MERRHNSKQEEEGAPSTENPATNGKGDDVGNPRVCIARWVFLAMDTIG